MTKASILSCAAPMMAQSQTANEEMFVYGTLSGDIGVARDKVPGTLQSLDADDVVAAHGPFDHHDASDGTYFEPDDTAGLFANPLTDPRSVTLIQPISAELGVKLVL